MYVVKFYTKKENEIIEEIEKMMSELKNSLFRMDKYTRGYKTSAQKLTMSIYNKLNKILLTYKK